MFASLDHAGSRYEIIEYYDEISMLFVSIMRINFLRADLDKATFSCTASRQDYRDTKTFYLDVKVTIYCTSQLMVYQRLMVLNCT